MKDGLSVDFGYPKVAYAIAIPARDEERRVEHCLDACRRAMDGWSQNGIITVLVNNSCDHTARRALAWARRNARPLRLAECRFSAAEAHAGSARRAALDFARAHVTAEGWLLTTDADSQPAPDWIGANLAPLADGRAAMVCGFVDLDAAEFARLPSWIVERDAAEDRYRRTALELASLLDPDMLNPWPFHGIISGASLAMSVAAYDRVGGAPIVPCGEDRALVRRFLAHDLPVLYADAPRVVTSGRLDGRAPGGMADTIASRLAGEAHRCDEELESAHRTWFRASLRGRLRRSLRDQRQCDAALSEAALSREQMRTARTFTRFGQLWAFVEHASPRLTRRRMLWEEMMAELPRLETFRDHAARAAAPSPAGETA